MTILVVTDNPEVCLFFTSAIAVNQIKEVFEFRYSVANNSPDPLTELGMTAIDLKNPNVIEETKKNYSLIISGHCKQIFPAALVNAVRCINIHPGLNPYNRGWYPQVFSILNGLPSGVTVHEMDEHIDHGAIIIQKQVELYDYDTSLSAYQRLLLMEKELIHRYLPEWIDGNYETSKPASDGNYNSPNDFVQLCELKLDRKGTLKEHLDLLRALTHDPYKNAYYYNEQGEKVYIGIQFKLEGEQ